MNQILDYGENEQQTSVEQEEIVQQPKTMDDYYTRPDNNYQPQMDFSGKGKDNKKTMKIFAIALGIFAIVAIIIAVGIFYITNNKQAQLPAITDDKPQILMEEKEETVEVTATYKDNLDKLIYTWGEGTDQVIPGTGINTITASINKPIGKNILKIKVIAQDQTEAYQEKEYEQEKGPDLEKPRITFETTDTKKLKISVMDNVGIKSFEYYWNEDEPTEVTSAVGRTEASIEVEIKKGKNKITVKVVDESDNSIIEEKEYTGVELPTITLYLTQDLKTAIATIKHERGISEVVSILNNKEDKRVYEGDMIKSEVKLEISLEPGVTNIIEIKATSVDGGVATQMGSAEGPAAPSSQNLNTQTQ